MYIIFSEVERCTYAYYQTLLLLLWHARCDGMQSKIKSRLFNSRKLTPIHNMIMSPLMHVKKERHSKWFGHQIIWDQIYCQFIMRMGDYKTHFIHFSCEIELIYIVLILENIQNLSHLTFTIIHLACHSYLTKDPEGHIHIYRFIIWEMFCVSWNTHLLPLVWQPFYFADLCISVHWLSNNPLVSNCQLCVRECRNPFPNMTLILLLFMNKHRQKL